MDLLELKSMRLPGFLLVFSLISHAAMAYENAIAADSRLFGVIRDSSSGEPIPGARISLMEGGALSVSTTTGADGAYAFEGLTTDPQTGSRYSLSILADRYWTSEIPIVLVMPGESKRFDWDMFKRMGQTILILGKGGASGPVPNARVTWRYRDRRGGIQKWGEAP